jgi:hypothetical protein
MNIKDKTFLDKKENKHLNALQRKYELLNRREEVSQLTIDEKRYYGEWLNSQDENHYDSVSELGGELSFQDNTFEDGLETTSKNFD